VCRDGGWNYGAPRTLDIDLDSYPETTGIAVAALHGVESQVVKRSLGILPGLLARCTSSEGASWLTIALSLHGHKALKNRETRPRSNVELALELLAERAASGEKVLVDA
jgi:hypothetical protein